MTQHPQPHFLEGRLEPECRDVQTPLECAALSIAISLKRIADVLEGTTERCSLVEHLSDNLSAISVSMRG